VLALLEGHEPGAPGGPVVEVCFSPRELLHAPRGARVVLLGADRDPAWLNQNRPVVHEHELAVFLWDTGPEVQVLRRQAPDFLDWVSHRIDVPAFAPVRAVEELRRMVERFRWVATQGMRPPFGDLGGPWKEIEIEPYCKLVAALEDHDVVVRALRRDEDAWRLLFAHAQVQWKHRVLLEDPEVVPPFVSLVGGASANWETAALELRARGVEHARLEAALSDLDPRLDGSRPSEPRILASNEALMRLLVQASTRRIDTTAAKLALERGLTDVAEIWARTAWQRGEAAAGTTLIRALATIAAYDRVEPESVRTADEEARTVAAVLLDDPGVALHEVYPALTNLAVAAGTLEQHRQFFDRFITKVPPEVAVEIELPSAAMTHQALGQRAYLEGRLEEASLHFEEACKLHERIVAHWPHAFEEGRLAHCMGLLGDVFLRRRMFPEARRQYERTRAFLERVARNNPADQFIQLELAIAYCREGALLAAEGNERPALDQINVAIDMLMRLGELGTDRWEERLANAQAAAFRQRAELFLAQGLDEQWALDHEQSEKLLAGRMPMRTDILLDLLPLPRVPPIERSVSVEH
jgi:tetratricopeptide (TPR) repeat protein